VVLKKKIFKDFQLFIKSEAMLVILDVSKVYRYNFGGGPSKFDPVVLEKKIKM
jgi:hypothetical protein